MGRLKIVYPVCCGMDVHRDFLIACIAATNAQGVTEYQSRRFSTYTGSLRELRDWLLANDCKDVCMESTGKYWFPVHNILEESCHVVVSHPKFVKAIKGKKTDKKDAQWIADLFKHDLVRGSFIPPKDIRQLRDLCRYWVKLSSYMTGEKNRAQNCLTVSNFKLDDVFSNVFGKSASAITTQLLEHPGEQFDVAPFVDGRCKTPIAQIQEAVDGIFTYEQAEKLKIIRGHMDSLERHKAELESLILEIAQNYLPQIELLLTVPGIHDAFTAIRILAEIGADMTVFDTSKHLCSWAGLTPQNAESAGKKKTTRIGKSGAYLKPLLIQVALAASRGEKHPEIYGKKQALQKRRGKKKAIVAIARRLLTAIYHILSKNEPYNPAAYIQEDKNPMARQISQEKAFEMLARMGFIVSNPSPLSSSGTSSSHKHLHGTLCSGTVRDCLVILDQQLRVYASKNQFCPVGTGAYSGNLGIQEFGKLLLPTVAQLGQFCRRHPSDIGSGVDQIHIMLRQAEFQQIPQPDGRLLRECFQFLFGQRFWSEEHPGLRVFAAFVIDAPPLTAAGNLQLAQMAVPPITTSFLAPADHMFADAAFRPFKIEQSFTLFFQ